MQVSTEFLSAKFGKFAGILYGTPPVPSRAPVPPPEMPTLPVSVAIIAMERVTLPPLAWRCGPQPWMVAVGPSMYRSASQRMVSAGTPQMADAHSGVFSPVPV